MTSQTNLPTMLLIHFRQAVRLLTIFPAPGPEDFDPQRYRWTVFFYPLVGLLLGSLLWILESLFSFVCIKGLGITPGESVFLMVTLALWIIATRGLHLDGFADTLDALPGGLRSQEDRLRILKDPHSGPFAVSGVVLLLVIKWNGVASPWALPAILFLGRLMILVAATASRYARPGGGLGQLTMTAMSSGAFSRWALTFHLVLYLLLGSFAVAFGLFQAEQLYACFRACFLAFIFGGLAIFYCHRKISGMTGDTLGFVCEISEAAAIWGFCMTPIPKILSQML